MKIPKYATELLYPIMMFSLGTITGVFLAMDDKEKPKKNGKGPVSPKKDPTAEYLEGYEDGCRHMQRFWIDKLKRMGFSIM